MEKKKFDHAERLRYPIRPMDELMKHMLRAMAWQRAKGELQSMLETYHNEREKFEAMAQALEAFVKEVEDQGWHE